MKKISVYLSMALALVGLASCSQDRDPKYQAPSEFTLNVPSMQDQYIELTEGNTLVLAASQPNYGYSAVADYSAEMSLTEDFAKSMALEAVNPHMALINVKQEDVALGICKLSGVTNEETYKTVFPDGQKPGKVYFRAVCSLSGVEGSKITSNVVSYNLLQGYFAVPVPGFIYLVGKPEGWAGPTEANASHYAEWRLFEDQEAIGSKIYSGTFDINAGEATFRFYTKLTGWDADSYGAQVDDSPIQFPNFDGSSSLALDVVKGKGSFEFPSWPGGKMKVTVDMSNMKAITATVEKAQ